MMRKLARKTSEVLLVTRPKKKRSVERLVILYISLPRWKEPSAWRMAGLLPSDLKESGREMPMMKMKPGNTVSA